ncbi:MAG: hypothetical protein E7183_03020 [Erysipelotrichaceae bacterium]|nr:hypothetical protein [Erysipelotrichaceae bacterium]
MNYFVRPIDEKDNLNEIFDVYCEPKTAYYVVEDKDGNIIAGLGVYKIEGNENTCELKDYFIVDSFRDLKIIEDLVNMCILFSKKYYNSICIKVSDDDIILMNVLINKKFKFVNEKIDNLDVLDNQKLYLLKYKTIGWKKEVFCELIGVMFAFILFMGLGLIVSLFLPDKCQEKLDFEWMMVLGGFVFIMLPCLLFVLIRMVFERKDKKK